MPATITGTFAATVNVAAYTNSYLDCTVGFASCPDQPVLPATGIFLYKVRGPLVGTKCVFSQAKNSTFNLCSFGLRRSNPSTQVFNTYPTGAPGTTTTRPCASQAVTSTVDEWLGYSFDRGTGVVQAYASTNGTTWVAGSTGTGTLPVPFDSTAALMIGTSEYSLGFINWDGRIYWAELRSGTSPTGGSVLWRFDANEHVTGTSWTDPRGITWTLTSSSAIVHV